MWPFTRTEQRQDYTTALLERIVAAAAVTDGANVGATAAAATAGGLLARSFAAATVEPSVERTGLDPSTLGDIGSALIFAGEFVAAIDVTEMGVRLIRASSWDVQGEGPDGWRYMLELPGATGTTTRHLPQEGVLHVRINCAAQEPHRGRSPLALAGLSAKALAEAERQISEEMSGPVGRLLPAPLDAIGQETGPLAGLEQALANLKGRSALVPSMAALWKDSPGATQGDWRSLRLGGDPPQSVVDLRRDYSNHVLASAGVPPQLFADRGQASAGREAFRFYLHGTVAPLARVVETEARRKLEIPVMLNLDALNAADVQGRARAFKSMVDAGLDLEKAAARSGLLAADDD